MSNIKVFEILGPRGYEYISVEDPRFREFSQAEYLIAVDFYGPMKSNDIDDKILKALFLRYLMSNIENQILTRDRQNFVDYKAGLLKCFHDSIETFDSSKIDVYRIRGFSTSPEECMRIICEMERRGYDYQREEKNDMEMFRGNFSSPEITGQSIWSECPCIAVIGAALSVVNQERKKERGPLGPTIGSLNL